MQASIPALASGRNWAISALRDLAIWWERDQDREMLVQSLSVNRLVIQMRAPKSRLECGASSGSVSVTSSKLTSLVFLL